MLSIVLYGRNDNYGYNLHKRAAISLNAMAAVLSAPDDEILFVDYNSDPDLPTFPEAIRDTLTPSARKRLRVIRVRGHIHQAVKRDSRLPLNEPLARNIAIRRMCPGNAWVLSTNTDMVFVPQKGKSLSEVAANLAEGYYALPRFEIPETMWESVDRKDPAAILRKFDKWGRRYFLNEKVLIEKYQLYDGPGDFQLFPRKAIAAIHGFNESMIHGWHVDSNMSKRLHLLYGETRSLAEWFHGYHCDHTRITTLAHAASRTENDWGPFFAEVASPHLPEQEGSWGLPDAIFEEVTFSGTKCGSLKALDAVFDDTGGEPRDVVYTVKSFNAHLYYDTRRVTPYLVDALSALPTDTRIGYFGAQSALLHILGKALKIMGWSTPITYHGPILRDIESKKRMPFTENRYIETASMADIGTCDTYIIDLHFPKNTAIKNSYGFDVLGVSPRTLAKIMQYLKCFLELAASEQRAVLMGKTPKKFIVLGVQATVFETIVSKCIGLVAVPYACHLRHGYVRSDADITSLSRLFTFMNDLEKSAIETLFRSIKTKYNTTLNELDFISIHNFIKKDIQATSSTDNGTANTPNNDDAVLASILFYVAVGYLQDAALVFTKHNDTQQAKK